MIGPNFTLEESIANPLDRDINKKFILTLIRLHVVLVTLELAAFFVCLAFSVWWLFMWVSLILIFFVFINFMLFTFHEFLKGVILRMEGLI